VIAHAGAGLNVFLTSQHRPARTPGFLQGTVVTSSAQRVIIFCFAGRRTNLEIQLLFIRRILADHPDVEYHVWNLARTEEDDRYVRGVRGQRITVINDFHGGDPWQRFSDVYRHYAAERYSNRLFVKLDDDVVFIEVNRFAEFIAAVAANRETVISATVINNAACTLVEPTLAARVDVLGLSPLQQHKSAAFAEISHSCFLRHWSQMLGEPPVLVPTDNWLSINMIGYGWDMGGALAAVLGSSAPARIAGRRFSPRSRVGDEAAVNMLPRLIFRGLVASHLTFGPQMVGLTEETLSRWREQYRELASRYLTRESSSGVS
jgi:hypothetical protein